MGRLRPSSDHPRRAVKVSQKDATRTPGDPAKTEQPTALRRMFDWYDHHDLLGNALTLRAILGREPRTLQAYFQELASGADQAD